MSDFRFPKGIYHVGSSWLLLFDIEDAEGDPVDVSGYTLRFVGRQPGVAGSLVVNRTNAAGITVSGTGNNRVEILVPPAITALATPGNMSCALWREDADPNTYPMKSGTVYVTPVTHRPP